MKQFGVPMNSIVLIFMGQIIPDTSTLAKVGVLQGDTVFIQEHSAAPMPSFVSSRPMAPHFSPALPSPLTELDMFDPEVQRRLEEQIQNQNIQENLTNAIEYR